MLSEKHKKEMLADARSKERAEAFRRGREQDSRRVSLDEYMMFLESVQKVFGPFPVSGKPTETGRNRL